MKEHGDERGDPGRNDAAAAPKPAPGRWIKGYKVAPLVAGPAKNRAGHRHGWGGSGARMNMRAGLRIQHSRAMTAAAGGLVGIMVGFCFATVYVMCSGAADLQLCRAIIQFASNGSKMVSR